MRIGVSKLEPLASKHYSTDLLIEVGGNGWDVKGSVFRVSISGSGSHPSPREYEAGYDPEFGLDHVETEEHYFLAMTILRALRGCDK